MDESAKELLRQKMERKYGPFNSRFCGLRQLQAYKEYHERIGINNINCRELTNINTKPDDTANTAPKTSTSCR
jgi:hypothetical protein